MSEMQKNKLLQKKVVASKWFGTARKRDLFRLVGFSTKSTLMGG